MRTPLGRLHQLYSHTLTPSLAIRIASINVISIILSTLVGLFLARQYARYSLPDFVFYFLITISLLLIIIGNIIILKKFLRPIQELRKSELNRLSEQAINAQEDERKRIARWLHDDASQNLSSIILNLEKLKSNVPINQGEVKDEITKIGQIVSNTKDGLRTVIHGLRPTILDDLGLLPAIHWYARTNLEKAGIKFELDLEDNNIILPTRMNTSIFRIVQEGINNIVQHSHAQNVKIFLSYLCENIYLRIEDDGVGFNISEYREKTEHNHWGLTGIEERTALIGGKFDISSTPNQGVILEITIPFLDKERTVHE